MNTTTITDADRNAAKAYDDASPGTHKKLIELLAEHFAAHRHSAVAAAVAKREAEIVMLADAAERKSKTYQQYANEVVRIVMNLRKQKTGGGA